MLAGSRRRGFWKYSPLLTSAQNHAQEAPPSHLEKKDEAPSAPRYAQISCEEKRSCGAAQPRTRRGSHSPGDEGTLIPVQWKDFMVSVDLSLGLARLECDGQPRPPLSLAARAATREGAERNWL